MYSLTSRAVPALVLGMKQRKPAVQTELVLGSNADLLARLREGTLDAALMAVPRGAADVESEPLFEDETFFAAPAQSPHAQRTEVDLGACADERFVSLAEGFATHDSFTEAFRIAGTDPGLLQLFASRCARALEDEPALASDCPAPADLLDAARTTDTAARDALLRLEGLLLQGEPA